MKSWEIRRENLKKSQKIQTDRRKLEEINENSMKSRKIQCNFTSDSLPVGRFNALIVFYYVLVLQELHDSYLVVEKLAEEFIRNVIFRHNFHGNHRFVAL